MSFSQCPQSHQGKDLPELTTYVSQKGMMPTVATNGYKLFELVQSGKFDAVEWVMSTSPNEVMDNSNSRSP